MNLSSALSTPTLTFHIYISTRTHARTYTHLLLKIDGLQNEIHVRDRKLASLDDFRQREATFQHRLSDMATQLKEKDEIHRAALEEMERTALAEREKYAAV